jgi:hypothetical protein
MLLQCLRAFCKAPGGAGCIWKYLEALARATGESERFAYGFRTELPFADVCAIAYGVPWKSRRRSWIRQGEEVKLCLHKTCEMIYMP